MGDWPRHLSAKKWSATNSKEKQLPQTVKAAAEFRIRLNGVYVPEVTVQRENKDPKGEMQLLVRDETIGWFPLDNNEGIHSGLPQFKLEFRDETSWRLLPDEMKQASTDKGWNTATPKELIDVLWYAGILK
jgi:hypothetical protein